MKKEPSLIFSPKLYLLLLIFLLLPTTTQAQSTKWMFNASGNIYSSPAIGSDGTVYIASFNGCIYAVNPNGSQKWVNSSYKGNIYSTPAIGADGTIYVGSLYGKLHALNPADGSEKWFFTTNGAVYSSPAIGGDGTIYVGTIGGYLHAVYPNGTQKWVYNAGVSLYWSSPVISEDGTIYVGTWGNGLYAINSIDGSRKWIFLSAGYVYPSPAIGADGTIYVGANNGYLYAIEPVNGTQLWAYQTGSSVYSSAAIGSDGTIYVGSFGPGLYAINPGGTLKWRFAQAGNVYASSPAIGADGTIYVGSMNSYLYAIKPDGTQKWSSSLGGNINSSPLIGPDGTVYIGSYNFYLYALNSTSSGLADSPWPAFRYNLQRTGSKEPLECQSGYFGPNCEPCLGGAGTPCSGHGTCDDGKDGTGECLCRAPFSGDACEETPSIDSLWAVDSNSFLHQIDPVTGAILNAPQPQLSYSDSPFYGLTFSPGSTELWGLTLGSAHLYRIDRYAGLVMTPFINVSPVSLSVFEDLAFGQNYFWAINVSNRDLYRIDPVTGSALRIANLSASINNPSGMDYGNGYLWVIDYNKLLYRVDPANGQTTVITSLNFAGAYTNLAGLAFGHGLIYALVSDSTNVVNNMFIIDPSSGEVLNNGNPAYTLSVSSPIVGLAYEGCDPGYYGPDCLNECPGGASNFCNGHGTCDDGLQGTGSCTCEQGFTGAACDGFTADCQGSCAHSRATCEAACYAEWNGSEPGYKACMAACVEDYNGCLTACNFSPDPIFWNSLGSVSELQNSIFGPGLIIDGTIGFKSGVFGNGFYSTGGWYCSNRILTPVNGLQLDPQRGTIEAWIKYPLDPIVKGYSHSMFSIIDGPYQKGDWRDPLIGSQVIGVIGDGTTGTLFTYYVEVNFGNSVQIEIPGIDKIFGDHAFHHVAIVWDKNGIDGTSNAIRLYIDNTVIGSSDKSDWGTTPDVGTHHSVGKGENIPSEFDPSIAAFVIDEVKVWDHARADFVLDRDNDGIADASDNCPDTPNGPALGTCISGDKAGETCNYCTPGCGRTRDTCQAQCEADYNGPGTPGYAACMTGCADAYAACVAACSDNCGAGGVCSSKQEDTNDDGVGDACYQFIDISGETVIDSFVDDDGQQIDVIEYEFTITDNGVPVEGAEVYLDVEVIEELFQAPAPSIKSGQSLKLIKTTNTTGQEQSKTTYKIVSHPSDSKGKTSLTFFNSGCSFHDDTHKYTFNHDKNKKHKWFPRPEYGCCQVYLSKCNLIKQFCFKSISAFCELKSHLLMFIKAGSTSWSEGFICNGRTGLCENPHPTTSTTTPPTTTTTIQPTTTTTIQPTTSTTIQPTTSTTTTTAQPTVIELSEFKAVSGNNQITIQWKTASEIHNAGFNLYRAEMRKGDYIKINDAFIPAQGSSIQGASYEFVDNAVQPGKKYFYKLEDVELSGKSTMHGPVKARIKK